MDQPLRTFSRYVHESVLVSGLLDSVSVQSKILHVLQDLPPFVKISAVLAAVALVTVYFIIATTPEGDKDSHGYYLLIFLVTALPLGIIVSTAAIIQSIRRRSGRIVAICAGSLFVGMAIALLCLFVL